MATQILTGPNSTIVTYKCHHTKQRLSDNSLICSHFLAQLACSSIKKRSKRLTSSFIATKAFLKLAWIFLAAVSPPQTSPTKSSTRGGYPYIVSNVDCFTKCLFSIYQALLKSRSCHNSLLKILDELSLSTHQGIHIIIYRLGRLQNVWNNKGLIWDHNILIQVNGSQTRLVQYKIKRNFNRQERIQPSQDLVQQWSLQSCGLSSSQKPQAFVQPQTFQEYLLSQSFSKNGSLFASYSSLVNDDEMSYM